MSITSGQELDRHVARLRRTLTAVGDRAIAPVRGVGYRFR
ncbi:MAG TPA: helix-turn-helix domain-containing protein [Blastococcus sp.]|jgi:DNA-binding winged helix-turn-helix (wHTH) protein|nr:helix-turn-helix domain-containing protein [Blastococcus sp.]